MTWYVFFTEIDHNLLRCQCGATFVQLRNIFAFNFRCSLMNLDHIERLHFREKIMLLIPILIDLIITFCNTLNDFVCNFPLSWIIGLVSYLQHLAYQQLLVWKFIIGMCQLPTTMMQVISCDDEHSFIQLAMLTKGFEVVRKCSRKFFNISRFLQYFLSETFVIQSGWICYRGGRTPLFFPSYSSFLHPALFLLFSPFLICSTFIHLICSLSLVQIILNLSQISS